MGTVILSRSVGVEQFVIPLHKSLPPFGIFPYPVAESVLDRLLFLLGKRRFFGIEDAPFPAVSVSSGVIYSYVAKIQRIFKNLVSVGPVRAIGHKRADTAASSDILVGDIPFRRKIGIIDFYRPSHIVRSLESLDHELTDILFVDPCRAEPDFDLGSVKVLGLRGSQCFNVCRDLLIVFRAFQQHLKGVFVVRELLAHIAG